MLVSLKHPERFDKVRPSYSYSRTRKGDCNQPYYTVKVNKSNYHGKICISVNAKILQGRRKIIIKISGRLQ